MGTNLKLLNKKSKIAVKLTRCPKTNHLNQEEHKDRRQIKALPQPIYRLIQISENTPGTF
jgi:hypothetical protein